MNRHLRSGAGYTVLLVAALTMAGCSGMQTVHKHDYSKLYESGSDVRFATELPVASAAEAETLGDKAERDGNLDLALFQYVRALDMDDSGPGVFYKVGKIHVRKHDPVLAELAFQLALQADPNHVGSLEELGLILLHKRKYDAAKKLLQKAAEKDYKRWRAFNGLGIIADLQGLPDIAELKYRSALRAQPNSAQLYNNFGYSRYLAGDLAGAMEKLRRAVQIDASYKLAWHNLGLIYAKRGHYEQAIDAFEHTMDRASAYNDVGYLCMNQGRYGLAETFLNKAIDLRPRYFAIAHQNLERLRRLRGRRGADTKAGGQTAARQSTGLSATEPASVAVAEEH